MDRNRLMQYCASRIAMDIMEIVAPCFREDEHHDLYAEILRPRVGGHEHICL